MVTPTAIKDQGLTFLLPQLMAPSLKVSPWSRVAVGASIIPAPLH